MSKLTKLIRNPIGFIRDGIENRLSISNNSKNDKPGKPSTFLIGFSSAWKPLLAKLFKDRALVYISINIDETSFNLKFKERLTKSPNSEIYVWGFKTPEFILDFIKKAKLPCKFVEDGFIRSVHLGSGKAPPRSWCFDSKTPYFDSRTPSDLEVLLSTYDFKSDTALIKRSRELINVIVNNNISKYNNSLPVNVHAFYGKKTSKRVLVVGQVEDDASIKYGCNRPITNFDLLSLACDENPEAQIFYKEHPDVLTGNRQNSSDMEKLKSRCHLLAQDLPLSQALETIDHVYTITSLCGFEALLRDIKVTALGCPFYANWGLTDDRQPNPRRQRKLTKYELFAGAYVLYPNYFDPETGDKKTIEETLQAILTERAAFYNSHNIAVTQNDLNAPSDTDRKNAKPSNSDDLSKPNIPAWFNVGKNEHVSFNKHHNKPIYLYATWTDEYTSSLIPKIRDDAYELMPLDLFQKIDSISVQKQVQAYAQQYPELYRKLLIRHLLPLSKHVSGVIFTFDWSPVMRSLAHVCEELNIPRILIPVEQVFGDLDQYYKDPLTCASMPTNDVILAGGGLQRDIFINRGYDASKIEIVGSVCFDDYAHYQPQLSRDTYSRIMGLDPEKKSILFLFQAANSATNRLQNQILESLFLYVREQGHQLLIRLPKLRGVSLDANLRARLEVSDCAIIDDEEYQTVSSAESIYHSHVICAIDSPLLFDGLLLEKPALAITYENKAQVWYQAGVIQIKDEHMLNKTLASILEHDEWKYNDAAKRWAATQFSCGKFDGQAAKRIRSYLAKLAQQSSVLTPRSKAVSRLEQQQHLDVIAVNLAVAQRDVQQTRIGQLLQANSVHAINLEESINATLTSAASAEFVIAWYDHQQFDIRPFKNIQRRLGLDIAYMSPGFINYSISSQTNIVLDSVVLDSEGFYFDSTTSSSMNAHLNSDHVIADDVLTQSKKMIQQIKQARIGRYHSYPDIRLSLGMPGRKKILILDQASNDPAMGHPSVQQKLFYAMVSHVLHVNDGCDIIIKQGGQPDGITLLSDELKSSMAYNQNVYLIDAKIHSHALLDLADEVYVIDDHFGFEALLTGKTVHCFGRPFYAGWGLTQDHDPLLKRARSRTLEELFYISYVQYSRYLDPVTSKLASLDQVLDYYVNAD